MNRHTEKPDPKILKQSQVATFIITKIGSLLSRASNSVESHK